MNDKARTDERVVNWDLVWTWIADKVMSVVAFDEDLVCENGKRIRFAKAFLKSESKAPESYVPVLVMGTTDGTWANTTVSILTAEQVLKMRSHIDRFMVNQVNQMDGHKGKGRTPISSL